MKGIRHVMIQATILALPGLLWQKQQISSSGTWNCRERGADDRLHADGNA
jgi:hypothetical protein